MTKSTDALFSGEIQPRKKKVHIDVGGAMMDWTTTSTSEKMAALKTGSPVSLSYNEIKTRNFFQAIWVALKDVTLKKDASILSVLNEAFEIVAGTAKEAAERKGKEAAVKFLTQVVRTAKEGSGLVLRSAMESVGIQSAGLGDVYFAMQKLANALANTPNVAKKLEG